MWGRELNKAHTLVPKASPRVLKNKTAFPYCCCAHFYVTTKGISKTAQIIWVTFLLCNHSLARPHSFQLNSYLNWNTIPLQGFRSGFLPLTLTSVLYIILTNITITVQNHRIKINLLFIIISSSPWWSQLDVHP